MKNKLIAAAKTTAKVAGVFAIAYVAAWAAAYSDTKTVERLAPDGENVNDLIKNFAALAEEARREKTAEAVQ